jgi:RNA polymerase sigma-70 factor (ECF subfamily)
MADRRMANRQGASDSPSWGWFAGRDDGVEDLSTGHFEALLAAAVGQDPAATRELFVRYQPALLRYLRSREPHHADDLAADVWLALAGGLGAFSGDERAFRAWLFTLARNVVTGHRRKGLRRRTDVVDHRTLADLAAGDEPDADVMGEVASQEALALIAHHLSAVQAEVVRLRVVAGLSAGEVAQLLGHTETWVRVTQHRALVRLARRLPLEGSGR